MEKTINYKWIKYCLLWKYYLSQSTTNKWRKNPKLLHREIRKENYWEIPEWYEIHHKDWNTLNNDIWNLEMLKRFDHLSIHMKNNYQNKEYKEKNEKHLNEIRDKAKEWHASEEWKERHRKHYEESLWKIEKNQFICKQCWKVFLSSHKNANYCSVKCIREAYKVEMTCSVCWKVFMRNKYRKSRKCYDCSIKTRNFIQSF